jgi:hypothetical protein
MESSRAGTIIKAIEKTTDINAFKDKKFERFIQNPFKKHFQGLQSLTENVLVF